MADRCKTYPNVRHRSYRGCLPECHTRPLALLNDTRRATVRKHRVGQRCGTGNDCARLEVVVIERGVEPIKSLRLATEGAVFRNGGS